jgi:heme exporter protein A
VISGERLIHLASVSVRAGATHILRDLDLDVHGGEALGVYGANGAGKTTLLRLAATLIRPSSGSGTVLGASLATEDRYEVRPRIGYVGHVPGLYPELTLRENLAFTADAHSIDRSQVAPALEMVGLGAASDRQADRCSHGMQRRAEFARVLMTSPEVLLLDEPHSALDADAVDLVDAIVERTTSAGGAAVLVSHDRDRVSRVADRFVEINAGRVA